MVQDAYKFLREDIPKEKNLTDRLTLSKSQNIFENKELKLVQNNTEGPVTYQNSSFWENSQGDKEEAKYPIPQIENRMEILSPQNFYEVPKTTNEGNNIFKL